MAETITVNSVDRSGVIQRKNVEWVEYAYLGEVGQGRLVIDDADGDITVPGFKPITVEQSSSTPARIFTGFAGKKGIRRGETYTSGASREYEVSTFDLNDLLRRYIIQGDGAAGGNRPAETVDERMAWLLASDFCVTLIADFGAVESSTVELDKADCRGKYPGDVLADMAKAIGFNYYVRYKSGETLGELVFRDDNTSTDDTCTLSISNDSGDIDSTTVFATQAAETELSQDPEHIYSGAYALHGNGQIYATRASTAAAFVARDGITEDSTIRTDLTAADNAEQFLDESATEEQMLPVVLRLRASKVGLIQAGQRISVRQTHMAPEGWDPARYARILRKRVTQPLNTDADYDVHLDLSPQEVPPEPDICNDLYDPTASGTYYPLGAGAPGYPAGSDGVVYYWRGGYAYPLVPTPGLVGSWHFGVWGAGGVGTIDYAGDCTGNRLILFTVGNGTWTIQTETYGGAVRQMLAYETVPGAAGGVPGTTITFNSGDSIEMTISDATDGDCLRQIWLGDLGYACGSKWGFSEAVWVAA